MFSKNYVSSHYILNGLFYGSCTGGNGDFYSAGNITSLAGAGELW